MGIPQLLLNKVADVPVVLLVQVPQVQVDVPIVLVVQVPQVQVDVLLVRVVQVPQVQVDVPVVLVVQPSVADCRENRCDPWAKSLPRPLVCNDRCCWDRCHAENWESLSAVSAHRQDPYYGGGEEDYGGLRPSGR